MQTEKSNVVKLNPPEKNNKPALFSFEDLSNEKGVLEALKTVSKALKSAGAEPLKLSGNDLNSVVAKALKGGRESGIRYKPLIFTFDDGQSIELRIKQTGDFYKVILGGNLVTGKTLPIKNQDDHQLAIKEIANAVSGNSKKYLAAIAKKAAKGDSLPKTTMSKKQQIKEMEKQRDEIKADIEAIDAEINRMNAEMGASDAVGQVDDIANEFNDYESATPEKNPSYFITQKQKTMLLSDAKKLVDDGLASGIGKSWKAEKWHLKDVPDAKEGDQIVYAYNVKTKKPIERLKLEKLFLDIGLQKDGGDYYTKDEKFDTIGLKTFDDIARAIAHNAIFKHYKYMDYNDSIPDITDAQAKMLEPYLYDYYGRNKLSIADILAEKAESD